MNTKSLFAAVAFAVAASGAFAQEIIEAPVQTGGVPLTRAAVKADLLAARAAGAVFGVGELGTPDRTPFVSTLTRAEVRAEAVHAMANADWRNLQSEQGGSYTVTNAAPQATRMAGK